MNATVSFNRQKSGIQVVLWVETYIDCKFINSVALNKKKKKKKRRDVKGKAKCKGL